MEFRNGIRYRLWPVYSRLARAYRATLLRRTRLVAVVGSYGKTTTTRAVLAALGSRTHQTLGRNCWNHLPDAVLHMRPADRSAVLEVGINGAGQMEQYARMIRPDIAVVTSIGSEHHRSLGDLSATREEKSRMVRALHHRGIAVLNGDDPNVAWMRAQTEARIVTFGLHESNDVFATDVVEEDDLTTTFHLHGAGPSRALTTRFVGRHMIHPILAAAAVAHAEGISTTQIDAALSTLEPTPGRLQIVPLPNDVTLLRDDHKSSLETVHAALDAFERLPATRKIVVMGEVSEPPGSQGPIYREIGRRVAEVADVAMFVGSNFQRYAAGAVAGGMQGSAIFNARRDVFQATEDLRDLLRAGDLVLLKGRDTQRLERIACGLQGRDVACRIDFCPTRLTSCEDCPMLERGWRGRPVVS
jgi:UDP-N-acetylmuramoyl-tripeptide--D-alanyl-D-alanine ligase